MKHTSHPEVIARLKRAEGHLRSIIGMFEDGRTCVQLAQQLQAVENAIGNAKRELIHDHIEHCLDDTAVNGSGDAKSAIKELKLLTKYLER